MASRVSSKASRSGSAKPWSPCASRACTAASSARRQAASGSPEPAFATPASRNAASTAAAGILSLATAAVAEPVRFNRDVRPILADHCFPCHGFDANTRKAGLRLDLREEALRPAKSGAVAIVPGKPASSELLRRIDSQDPEDRMPPARSHAALPGAQREVLRRWIDEGAEYEAHWAFVPPVRPTPPEVRSTGWVRNPIDRFILRRLEQSGLAPSPEAGPEILFRRMSLDLTGLPPTPGEVREFLRDPSPAFLARWEGALSAATAGSFG